MARTTVEDNIQYDDERKLYYVTLSRGKDITGKRIRETKTFTSKREAVKYRNENKSDTRSVGWQAANSNISLTDYGSYFFENCLTGRSPTTIYSYKHMWENHIVPALGSLKIGKVAPQHLTKYYRQAMTTKKLSSNTVRKHHDLLSLIFNRALKEGVIKASPLAAVEAPRVERTEAVTYTAEQLLHLLDEAKTSEIYVAVMLGAHLGLRRGEICGLTWDHVDLDNRTV